MPVDMLLHPRWKAEDLGLPIPDSPHAVSACLPLWQHNIDYEKQCDYVHQALQAGYPRFALHPLIKQLCEQVVAQYAPPDHNAVVFPSPVVAQRAAAYVQRRCGAAATIQPLDVTPLCAVIVPHSAARTLREYWQHFGEFLSSRVAELALNGKPAACTETSARSMVRKRVADLHGVDESQVRLFPSGMAAIAACWRAIRKRTQAQSVQFGFPYVDTLKIQERYDATKPLTFLDGDASDLESLRNRCATTPVAGLFCETPTNPLLLTPDVTALRALADRHQFPLIIDDTLGACTNLNVLPHADVVVTSLTKFFSGAGDVLAGAAIANTNRPLGREIWNSLTEEHEHLLADVDVSVLEANSRDLTQRIAAINANGEALAAFFREHPAIEQVFYPDESHSSYGALRRPDGGFGGLMSIVLRDPQQTTPAVFDRLRICKGPNLGTSFTLCCPFTILAHYDELDFAESHGVSRWLIRISVGTEPFDQLRERFSDAMRGS